MLFNIFYKHLPLLLQILSSQLSLSSISTILNVKEDFSTAQTNESDYNQISGVFWTFDTFEMQKKHRLFVIKTEILLTQVH